MSATYLRQLDHERGVTLRVHFSTAGREVVDYAVVLLVRVGDAACTVRVYDGAHGVNEMHRYTRAGGKQAASRFHRGTLGDGMRSAIDEVARGYRTMIEGWEGR